MQDRPQGKTNQDATFSQTAVIIRVKSAKSNTASRARIRKLRTTKQSFKRFHNSNIEVKYLQTPTIRHAKQRRQTRYTAQDNSTTIHATQTKATSRMNELSHTSNFISVGSDDVIRRMSPDSRAVRNSQIYTDTRPNSSGLISLCQVMGLYWEKCQTQVQKVADLIGVELFCSRR